MHRFTIDHTLATTPLGGTYVCRFNDPARRRALLVLKYSSLATRRQLLSTITDADMLTVDDPNRKRAIVARLIASGGHENVVQCYDQFVSTDPTTGDECVCLVMEFCDDGDLCSIVTASPHGISEAQAICVMIQVARGVLFLQSRLGLAHCDLSLENVLLRHGICKLADFGLAKPVHDKAFGRVGKSAYMAPEVVACSTDGYDSAPADIWSLGIMLFILLTGSTLVNMASHDDVRFVALTRHGVGSILRLWGFDISLGLVKLLDKMLTVDPTQRPTVGVVLLGLEQLEGKRSE